MLLIFDTYGGLCNQFYDILCAINFCEINKIPFTFRHASLRNKDLVSWFNVKFSDLFDTSFLKDFSFYVKYDDILNKINHKNTFNYYGNLCCIQMLNTNSDLLEQIFALGKEYVVLKQFFGVYACGKIIHFNILNTLMPSKHIYDKYLEIEKNMITLRGNENYNFIHYRYESDFINCFQINNMQQLSQLIHNNKFKNPNLKIWIATTDIEKLLHVPLFKNKILFKNETELSNFNFEEKAFIDFLFGKKAQEVIGHSKSCFSQTLNNFKGTKNFYDLMQ
jgi:hypothetical protein